MRFLTLAMLGAKAALAEQLIDLFWQGNVPDSGLDDVAFPMNMAGAPHESGYYFEQSVGFKNYPSGTTPIVYTGLQPRPDNSGGSVIHAVFSSFIAGTTTDDGNCHDGADGGAGVSCAIEINAPYDRTYNLYIDHQGQLYYGTLVDPSTGQQWSIGSFTLPDGTSGMLNNYAGFMEYYDTGLGDCSQHPATEVTFGVPFTTSPGVTLSLTEPYQASSCNGGLPYSANKGSDGSYDVSIRA